MRIYTRTGDRGETSLIGGRRVPKDDLRIEAYGTVDELNALLGVVAASTRDGALLQILKRLQHELFVVGADLAAPNIENSNRSRTGEGEQKRRRSPDGGIPRIDASSIQALEASIDSLQSKLSPLSSFILPGGDKTAASLHHARTVCRRAERLVVRLARDQKVSVNPDVLTYLNRLSDLLFVLARWVNRMRKRKEDRWRPSTRQTE